MYRLTLYVSLIIVKKLLFLTTLKQYLDSTVFYFTVSTLLLQCGNHKPQTTNLPKCYHVTSLLWDLHWLSVVACIRLKQVVKAYKGCQWNCTCLPPSVGQTTHPPLIAHLNYLSWTLVPPSLRAAKSRTTKSKLLSPCRPQCRSPASTRD